MNTNTELKITSFKDLSALMIEVSEDTGYSYDFLLDCVQEQLDDGESMEAAYEHISGIAYEQDF